MYNVIFFIGLCVIMFLCPYNFCFWCNLYCMHCTLPSVNKLAIQQLACKRGVLRLMLNSVSKREVIYKMCTIPCLLSLLDQHTVPQSPGNNVFRLKVLGCSGTSGLKNSYCLQGGPFLCALSQQLPFVVCYVDVLELAVCVTKGSFAFLKVHHSSTCTN